MQCPECRSTHIRKNGKRRGKQNHICVECGRQFLTNYTPPQGYPDEVKRECIKMYVNGSRFRAIERVKGVHHTTIIYWVKQLGAQLLDADEPETPPEVGGLDELETFVRSKKNKIWFWTAVEHFKQGILGWVVGGYNAETFEPLGWVVSTWQCYLFLLYQFRRRLLDWKLESL